VQGVDSAVVYDADATNFVSQTGSVNSNNAEVEFKDYQRLQ
jgi:hypothetical protein